MENNELTKEEATAFFSEFYRGEHHIPGFEPKPFGPGWHVKHDRGELSTFDFSDLTRLVIMAHDYCYRVGLQAHAKNTITIAIWKRDREGSISRRHPTLEQAIETLRVSSLPQSN